METDSSGMDFSNMFLVSFALDNCCSFYSCVCFLDFFFLSVSLTSVFNIDINIIEEFCALLNQGHFLDIFPPENETETKKTTLTKEERICELKTLMEKHVFSLSLKPDLSHSVALRSFCEEELGGDGVRPMDCS